MINFITNFCTQNGKQEFLSCHVIDGKKTICNITNKFLKIKILLENTTNEFLGIIFENEIYLKDLFSALHGSCLGVDAGGKFVRVANCNNFKKYLNIYEKEILQSCKNAKIG